MTTETGLDQDRTWRVIREDDGRIRLSLRSSGTTVSVLLTPNDARKIGQALTRIAEGVTDA